MAAMSDIVKEIRNNNQGKESQMAKLKYQLDKMLELNCSLQMELKNTESTLKQLELENVREKELTSNNKMRTAKKNKEIEYLNMKLKEKETTLQACNVRYHDAVKQHNEVQLRLNEVIRNLETKVLHMQEEINRRDIEQVNFGQKNELYKHIQQELDQAREKELILTDDIQMLQTKNNESEVWIAELKFRLKEFSQTLYQKELELSDANTSLHNTCQEKESQISELKNQLDKMSELKGKNCSLQMELKNKEKHLKKLEQENASGKELTSANKNKEIEELNMKLEEKKTTLQALKVQYHDTVKQHDDVELKLNEVIRNQETKIFHMQEEINRRDMLQVKNTESEFQIVELKHKLKEIAQRSHQREVELSDAHKKINHLETELKKSLQEISNEKQLLKVTQIQVTAMSEKNKTLMAEIENKKADELRREKVSNSIVNSQAKIVKSLHEEPKKREMKINTMEKENTHELIIMESKIADLNDQVKHYLSKLQEKEAELAEIKSSRLMDDRLTENKPNNTDLSDTNRPTKIAENFAELYESGLADAFDVLKRQFRSDEAVIGCILHILQDTRSFCNTTAQHQMDSIERELSFASKSESVEILSDIKRWLKERRKTFASDVVGNLHTKYVSYLKHSEDQILRAALEVTAFTSVCVEICWLMAIQDPPLVFAPLPKKGTSFDTNVYKPYTKIGTQIDYIVWPCLLLHEGGPILAKGVAQGNGRK